MEQVQTTKKLDQTDYEKLVEERLAFQTAGMAAKVQEWDYKIRVCEASMHYTPTSFSRIVDDLGIKGLNEVLNKRKAFFAEKQAKAKDLARQVLGRALQARTISEATLWSMIEDNNYRFVANPLAKIEAIKRMLPKMRGTARKLLEHTLNQEQVKVDHIDVTPDLMAYVKIVTIENYKADDNPPMEILKRIAEAKDSGLFSKMVIAYPMVGPVKRIDPIVIGIIQNPHREFTALDTIDRLWLDGDAPVSFVRKLDWGDMFKIAEWI